MTAAIVTDIEGTTSSLAFVKDVLFPYAGRRLPAFVRAHRDRPDVARELAAVGGDVEAAIATLMRWMTEDRKAGPLKTLQGLIWVDGYTTGELVGHVYDDAARRLRAWHDAGVALYVYSSGSALAQQLLFRHSRAGDLAGLFRGFFDTTIGSKREQASYDRIVAELGCPAGDVAFLSDVREELDAARAAGMCTVWVCRDQLPDVAPHPVVRDFDAIELPR